MKSRLPYILFIIIVTAIFEIPFAHSAGIKNKYSVSGKTMGTYYNVLLYTHKKVKTSDLKQKIDAQLRIINLQMSYYLNSSELSKFNRANKDETINISKDFYKVITQANVLYDITNGAWDGTVRPIYELWKFDKSQKNIQKIPVSEQIKASLKKTGFNNIIIAGKTLTKTIPFLKLDLGSIAKGYGVDVVATLLNRLGHKDFFVEIGGEIYVSGRKNHNKKWNIGISNPKHDNTKETYKVLNLSDKAIATSGTYLNFFELNGKTYSHIINPKTGWPVNNDIVSVSVLADNCTFADGLATALMVMGKQKGLELINRLDNVECMIVIKTKDERLIPIFSKNFENYLH